jgi:hypothetical protein
MALKTLFFVQPYFVRKNKLFADGAKTFLSLGEAQQAGAVAARRRAGVVVLSQSYDTERQMLGRPSVLHVYGRVPDEWGDNLKVAA